MNPRRRVLLVSHEASRTGAPMVALLVARALVEHGEDVAIAVRRDGPLMPEFSSVSPTRHELLHRVRRRLLLMRSLRHLVWLVDLVLAVATVARHRADLVYVNSTAAAIYVTAARWLGLPVVLHVHESADNTRIFLDQARVRQLAGVTLVACSPRVRSDLCALTGRAPADVHLLPSVPDDSRVRAMATAGECRGQKPGLVVGATGSVGHRKGTDLWLRVADRVRQSDAGRDVTFVWVGELADPAMARSGQGVDFIGPLPNPFAEMACFDVATLPSRDDPFPLVVLESMLLGIPVVAFDVGDVREQVGDTGFVVPPGDIEGFAAAVLRLLRDGSLRDRLGAAARERADQLYSARAFALQLDRVLQAPTVSGPAQHDAR